MKDILNINRIMFFVILNIAIFAAFLTLDLLRIFADIELPGFSFGFGTATPADILKFIGLISCLVIAIKVLGRSWQKRDAKLQIAILAFTILADFFLLFTDMFAEGILIFYIAHILAIWRYLRPVFNLSLAIAALASVDALFFAEGLNAATTSLAAGYAALILIATIGTFIYKQPPSNQTCSRLGMCLFLLCDAAVAIVNTNYIDSSILYAAASVLMWAFYLPAQTLLALSAYDFYDILPLWKKSSNSSKTSRQNGRLSLFQCFRSRS